jgi:hypothetical protein
MKKIIHVNRNILASNKKHKRNEDPITVKLYNDGRKTCSTNMYASRVEIDGPCVFIHDEENPLSCGARVWIETSSPVKVFRSNMEDVIL